MFNTSILYQQMANQNLGLLYANYVALQQKMMENSVYQNYMNFNSYISYAVSMDFKKFQAQYELQQNEKSLTNVQKPSKEVLQKPLKQVPKKKQEKNQKNLNHKSQQIDKSQQVDFTDLDEKTQKEEPKSKALTLDETSQKIQFDDCSIKENKNSDKKFKKSYRSDKYQETPQIDLIDFAFIRKDPFDRSEIEKRKSSLLARQVENWNELQKTRRNQKLQLRRIKY